MIDLTKDVSPAVLAETAAKLEEEQRQREEEEAQKALAEATKAFDARLVSCLQPNRQRLICVGVCVCVCECMHGRASS